MEAACFLAQLGGFSEHMILFSYGARPSDAVCPLSLFLRTVFSATSPSSFFLPLPPQLYILIFWLGCMDEREHVRLRLCFPGRNIFQVSHGTGTHESLNVPQICITSFSFLPHLTQPDLRRPNFTFKTQPKVRII